MQIGELFILRISIHLNGSVLDTPELFWVEPHLEPVYRAVRSYLEMDQRVGLLTERLDVIADLLAVLKDQLSHGHGEMLEWIGESIFDFYRFDVQQLERVVFFASQFTNQAQQSSYSSRPRSWSLSSTLLSTCTLGTEK